MTSSRSSHDRGSLPAGELLQLGEFQCELQETSRGGERRGRRRGGRAQRGGRGVAEIYLRDRLDHFKGMSIQVSCVDVKQESKGQGMESASEREREKTRIQWA
eukprot:763185-Hanusia_phi.AAC.7